MSCFAHVTMNPEPLAHGQQSSGTVVGRQSWRTMLFLHWPVPVDAIQRLLPKSLVVDTFEGRAWVTVIPFAMRNVRPALVPSALGIDVLETNVRTYVREPGGRHGIWFLSLEASSLPIVVGARVLLGLPYKWARMQMRQTEAGRVEYQTRRFSGRARHSVSYEIGAATGSAAPGTLDHFLVERYTLFSVHAGLLLRQSVAHAPYLLHEARVLQLDDGLLQANRIHPPVATPEVTHYSPGVDVDILAPHIAGTTLLSHLRPRRATS
jgi:uncharacterized protein YqjF (DUF2071 family)